MRTLYFNGNIITMANRPMPEAVLTENGKIIDIGNYDTLMRKADKLYDLKGKTMLPSFIDGHSHFTTVANSLAIANLSSAKSVEDIIKILVEYKKDKELKPDEFIVGFGYDNNMFPDKKHPTKQELDKVSAEYPVVISHTSGHMGVVNSKALELMGISDKTANPEGGVIGRNADGCINGYLEETAFTSAAKNIKQPDFSHMKKLIAQAEQIYFKNGITTIQDGFAGEKEWDLLKYLSTENNLTADVVCYIDINTCPEIVQTYREYSKYKNNLRIGGYKLFLDGSPQGKTAWMTAPYKNSGNYCGYPIYEDHKVIEFVKKALNEKQQLLCHCNGDAAAQQFISAYENADISMNISENFRPVLVHGQLATPQQMESVSKIGMIVSFFVAHIWQWGDIHLENFGDRAMKICPVNSANKNGVFTTFHQDSPVLPPNMLDSIWCAVNRITKSGVKLDEKECISVYDALKAVTINAAYQYGEEKTKGSIEVGKDASFVILSDNPLLCDKLKLKDIIVETTILRDKVVYKI